MVTTGPAGSLDRNDPEALTFLRRRVMAYGLIVGALGVAGLGVRFGFAVSFDFVGRFLDESIVPHVAGAFTFLALALACRLGPLKWGYLVAVEAIGMLVGSYAYIWMGTQIPLAAHPGMIVFSVLAFGFYARAIYVPSPPRRTFILGVLIWFPLVFETYRTHIEKLPDIPELLQLIDATNARYAEDVGPATMQGEALGQAIQVGVWWLFTTILATLASKVIYGLRRQVRDIKKLGQYTLGDKLGEGGMGLVYRASHAMLRRPTAVKLLPAERTGDRALARFEREVQLTASLTHPNTVTIFDYGRTPDGVFYYAMELLDGATLEDVIAVDGPLPAGRVRHILHQAASALVEAHGVGLIHRDIKPANLMLTRQGGEPDVTKLVDFGLVKELDADTSAALSQINVIAGTPYYMSPEAITSPETLDGRGDLYALGAVGYFLLTGENVFEGKNVVEVCGHHLHSVPKAPSSRTDNSIPAELEALLLRALSKDPAERHSNATEMRNELASMSDTWSVSDAESWWGEFGPALAALQKDRQQSSSGRTVIVDLEKR